MSDREQEAVCLPNTQNTASASKVQRDARTSDVREGGEENAARNEAERIRSPNGRDGRLVQSGDWSICCGGLDLGERDEPRRVLGVTTD